MNKMTVASFNEHDTAEVLVQRLQEAGIKAEIYDESKLQRFWFMSSPYACQKIRVHEEDFEKAKTLLEGWDVADHALDTAVRCPQCHSPRSEYPQFTRKFMTTTLVELFCLTKLVDKEFYCADCHYTWPKVERVEPERDILGWPVEKNPSGP